MSNDSVDSPALTAFVVAGGDHLNIRSGPNTAAVVLALADDGAALSVIGRNAAGDWLQIQISAVAEDVGWVAAAYMEVNGSVNDLPMVEASDVSANL